MPSGSGVTNETAYKNFRQHSTRMEGLSSSFPDIRSRPYEGTSNRAMVIATPYSGKTPISGSGSTHFPPITGDSHQKHIILKDGDNQARFW